MATIITVQGKVITIPKTPYLVQTDKASEQFQFMINNPSTGLAACDFYLLFKTAKNTAALQPLTSKTVDPVTGIIKLDWLPNEEFTGTNGYTDIQLKAMIGQTLVWNTTKATVYVYNELLNTAAAMVNPSTPTLFLYYLHVMQGLKSDIEDIYEAMMNNPTIEVDSSTGTPSAEITASGTGSERHYHFSFHNLKGESGGVIGATYGWMYRSAFYSNEQHTVLITPVNGRIYIDKHKQNAYLYDSNKYSLVLNGKAHFEIVGDGRRSYIISHHLNSTSVVANCWASGETLPGYSFSKVDANNIQLDFDSAVSNKSAQVLIEVFDFADIEATSVDWANVKNVSYATPSEMEEILNSNSL